VLGCQLSRIQVHESRNGLRSAASGARSERAVGPKTWCSARKSRAFRHSASRRSIAFIRGVSAGGGITRAGISPVGARAAVRVFISDLSPSRAFGDAAEMCPVNANWPGAGGENEFLTRWRASESAGLNVIDEAEEINVCNDRATSLGAASAQRLSAEATVPSSKRCGA